ncbi:MAG: SH3 domain-containing protein [Chloroflexi bacterium]|nr:SH3 domain-containing protein [Chloroflexota bacterium]
MNASARIACPGCGGLNPRDVSFCDWCGRSFLSPGRQISARGVRLGVALLFTALVAAVVLLAVLNAQRPSSTQPTLPTPTQPRPTAAASTPTPPLALAPTQAREQTPTPSPTPRPSPTATPEPVRAARIARTGGLGAYLRREPSTTAAPIVALREGTQVTALNQEEVTAARVWRLVRDPRGLQGWVLADFLEFSPES